MLSHFSVFSFFLRSLLRYLLFNFPVLSALVGVSTNFIFLSFLFILSYTRQILREEQKPEQVRGEIQYCCRAAHFTSLCLTESG